MSPSDTWCCILRSPRGGIYFILNRNTTEDSPGICWHELSQAFRRQRFHSSPSMKSSTPSKSHTFTSSAAQSSLRYHKKSWSLTPCLSESLCVITHDHFHLIIQQASARLVQGCSHQPGHPRTEGEVLAELCSENRS